METSVSGMRICCRHEKKGKWTWFIEDSFVLFNSSSSNRLVTTALPASCDTFPNPFFASYSSCFPHVPLDYPYIFMNIFLTIGQKNIHPLREKHKEPLHIQLASLYPHCQPLEFSLDLGFQASKLVSTFPIQTLLLRTFLLKCFIWWLAMISGDTFQIKEQPEQEAVTHSFVPWRSSLVWAFHTQLNWD